MIAACLALALCLLTRQTPASPATGPPARQIDAHATEIEQLALSPDGSVLVTAAGSEVHAWDLKRDRELWSVTVKFGPVDRLTVGREHVFYSLGTARVLLLDLDDGELSTVLNGPNVDDASRCFIVGPKEAWIWLATDAGLGVRVRPSNPSSGWSLHPVPARVVTALSSNAKGSVLVLGGADSSIRFANPKTGRVDDDRACSGLTGSVTALAVDPKGKWLGAGSDAGELRIWKFSNGKPEHELQTAGAAVLQLAVDPKGKYLASGDAAGTIVIWDLKRGEQLLTLPGAEEGRVRGLVFVDKGEQLASIRASQHVTVWDLSDL